MNEDLTAKPAEPVTETVAEPIVEPKKPKIRHVCKYCNDSFATKQTLAAHAAKGICLGRGYMCLRCFKVKRTASELQRHQSAENKCKPSDRASVRRDEHGNVNIIIER